MGGTNMLSQSVAYLVIFTFWRTEQFHFDQIQVSILFSFYGYLCVCLVLPPPVAEIFSDVRYVHF